MRPTTSIMLQQNNNNNYPCLSMSGSTPEMLQKCSRASLPFPSRLELGLGDLPLIRGLRAWALCSKNRRKAGGLLGGGQAPIAPPTGRRGSSSCPRPADVYLSGEWGHMAYGLPLGPDAGQAGIRALVTVATLKTSEGSGKTQTQCLFLQTEKGSCLYSTAKPVSGAATSTASSVVGGWLKGKTGGSDTQTRRSDHSSAPVAQTGANRVRVRSGRRWRKSCNAAGREKPGLSRDRQQSSGEDPDREKQEELDKESLDSKQLPNPQLDTGGARQEKEGAFRSPRCCRGGSRLPCTQCGRKAHRKESQDDHKGGESPRRGIPNGQNSEVKVMRKERQKNEEEEKRGLCESDSANSVSAILNPDLDSNHFSPESHSNSDTEEIRETKSNEEMHIKADYSRKEVDTSSEVIKVQANNDSIHGPPEQVRKDSTTSRSRDFDYRKPRGNSSEERAACVKGFSDLVEAEPVEDVKSLDGGKKEGHINQTSTQFAVIPSCFEDVSVWTRPASISAAVSPETSTPVEGSKHNADLETCGVLRDQESSNDPLHGYQQEVAECGLMGKGGLDITKSEQQEQNCATDRNNTVNKNRTPWFLSYNVENRRHSEVSPTPHRPGDPSMFETDSRIETEKGCNFSKTELNRAEQRDGLVWENREEESQEENIEQRANPEEGDQAGEIRRKECTCEELNDLEVGGDYDKESHTEDVSAIQEDDIRKLTGDCGLKDSRRLQESADGHRCRRGEVGDTSGQISIIHAEANREISANATNVACVDPSNPFALPLANPAPSLPFLGSMTTSLPYLGAEKEEEEVEGACVSEGEEGQEGKKRHATELEELGEEVRDSTVATEDGSKEEEEEDEFGVFMQAEGEPAWSEGSTMPASVPCRSRASAALGDHAISGDSAYWTPGWMETSFHQSDDTWTAFPQVSSDERQGAVGQWWPASTVEESRGRASPDQNLVAVFAEAFPLLPNSSSSDPCDLETVPTLTQLLRGKASQDQGLLDSFHDLNKMICQRFKRANGVSRDLLLKTLQLQPPDAESRPAPRTASRRLSPGLPTAHQYIQNAAAKRRLSYDYNRNIME